MMMLLLRWMKREVLCMVLPVGTEQQQQQQLSSRRAYSWDDDDRQLHIYVDAYRPIRYRSHTMAR